LKRDVFVVAGRITFVPQEDAETLEEGLYITPGLVDAHAHLALSSPAPAGAPTTDRVRQSARAHLDAAVLAVREPGGPDHSSYGLGPEEGLPRVITAGRFLAPPGRYFPGLAREVPAQLLAEAATEELQASGACTKVIGDFFESDGRITPNYPASALAEAARAVHKAGGRIAIHATIAESLEAAIEAGFDSIEHGMGMHDDHLGAMASRGIAFVPTLLIVDGVRGMVQEMTGGNAGPQPAELLRSLDRHAEMVRRAVEVGVTVLAGTDAGMGPHGMVRYEIGNLLEAGVAPELALAAGSWEARRFLGLPSLEEGAPADLVAYADDPRGEVEQLANPRLVMLAGNIINARAH
jgi:imidazolonepropionase-like amidohydrolase